MKYSTILSVAQAFPLVERREALVFDCSFDLADGDAGYRAFLSGHIPGAQYLHLDHDLSGKTTGLNGRHPLPHPDVFAATMRKAGLTPGQQVIAYDGQGGPYAARFWWLLRWIGHDNVAILDGGQQAWLAAQGMWEQGEAQPHQVGDFVGRSANDEMIVSVDEILSNLTQQSMLVVDARSAERFSGQPNPLDPVAGHIPHATNRFYKDNLTTEGVFKSPRQLVQEWAEILQSTSVDQAVMQCGSGVTACHNILALAVAGMGVAKLYPGSWSEWIADPSRPIMSGYL